MFGSTQLWVVLMSTSWEKGQFNVSVAARGPELNCNPNSGMQVSSVIKSYQKLHSAWAPWPPLLRHHHQLEENGKTWTETEATHKRDDRQTNQTQTVRSRGIPADLWLLAEGRSSTMITSRMVENSRRQKASSTHKSLHPCGKDRKRRGGNTEVDVIRLKGKHKTTAQHPIPENKPTVWQSTSLKTLVVQMMNMIEAVDTK